ncbi:hypothetical protein [Undibacterium sp.]|uniref:hypothetical protein n=2 Tax=Undibacterium TaxID=401469 RepID=UPI00273075C6|nr:hypothetical protein [Undibacterium sp.]MDP1979551.1 hypothetical protein [Undibacterium sp.]
MKTMTVSKILLAGAACASVFITNLTQAQDIGVSVQFGQPGFYGHVDIGNFPQPSVIYREPRIVQRGNVVRPPMYLVVPPGHRNKWGKSCYRYDACDRQVYFVQENWYNTQVVPRYRDGYYREHEYDRRDDGRGRGNERGRERNHGRGNGHGRGHGRD